MDGVSLVGITFRFLFISAYRFLVGYVLGWIDSRHSAVYSLYRSFEVTNLDLGEVSMSGGVQTKLNSTGLYTSDKLHCCF